MNDNEISEIKAEQRRQRVLLSVVSTSMSRIHDSEAFDTNTSPQNTKNANVEAFNDGERYLEYQGTQQSTGEEELQTIDNTDNLHNNNNIVTISETNNDSSAAKQVDKDNNQSHHHHRRQNGSREIMSHKIAASMVIRLDDPNYSSNELDITTTISTLTGSTKSNGDVGRSSVSSLESVPQPQPELERQQCYTCAPEPGAYHSNRTRRVSRKGVLTPMPELAIKENSPPPLLLQKHISLDIGDSNDRIIESDENGESKKKRAFRFLVMGMVVAAVLALVLGVGLGAGLFDLGDGDSEGESGTNANQSDDTTVDCTDSLWEFYNSCHQQPDDSILPNSAAEEQTIKVHCGAQTPQYVELREILSVHAVRDESSCDPSNLALLALTEWASMSGLFTTANTSSVVSLLDVFAITTLSYATGGPQAWDTEHNYSNNTNSSSGYFLPERLCSWKEDKVVECDCTTDDGCQLTGVDVTQKGLSGTLPTQIGLLTSLETFVVLSNALTGTVPSEVGLLTGLRHLALHTNQLRGMLPTEIGLLTNLERLEVGKTRLTGPLPSEIGQMESLKWLLGRGNKFFGHLPSELFSLENMEFLDLATNELEGSLSSNIERWTKLKHLDLTANGLYGALPTGLSSCTNLTSLQLGFNEFSGTVPSEYQALTNLVVLDLASNSFEREPIPNMTAWTNLEYLYLQDIRLTGTLPESMWLLTKLRGLDLSASFLLSGTLPGSVQNLQSLETLKLNGNKFGGTLPSDIGLMSNLKSLILGVNDFTGTLPASFGQLENLEVMQLASNDLEGAIPAEVCQLWRYSLQSFGLVQPYCPELMEWLGGLTCPSFDCCRVCEHLFP